MMQRAADRDMYPALQQEHSVQIPLPRGDLSYAKPEKPLGLYLLWRRELH
jgi:hypothetical protein